MRPKEKPAVLDLIGNTPLVEVTRLDTGPCKLLLKLESQNPGGSIKDRIGVSMIEAAERRGALKPGGTVVEATAGNTGLGLALVARAKGYRIVLVVPDKMSTEKVLQLKALGADVRITRYDVGKGHPSTTRTTRRGSVQEIRARSTPTSSESRQPGGARAHHLAGALAAERTAPRRDRRRRRLRRHADRAQEILPARRAEGRVRAGRSDGLDPRRLHRRNPRTAGSWAVEGIGGFHFHR
jgi:hypothetical protein